jgi:hypothetical protein
MEMGEYENAYRPFSEDPYGCKDPGLVSKRVGRNPFARMDPYVVSCPELQSLLTQCQKPRSVDLGMLPWL